MRKFALCFAVLIILGSHIALAESFVKVEQTCSKGDGCKKDCENGDYDCSCESQNGDVCEEFETCNGRLLSNWRNKVCCSSECTNGSIKANVTKIKIFSNELPRINILAEYEDEKKEDSGMGEIIVVSVIAFLGILIFLGEALYRPKNNPLMNILQKEEHKIDSDKAGSSELLNTVIESLTEDEAKVVRALLKNEGIYMEDLRKKLGFSKEKMAYSMIKLDRRQIIKSKGTNNPQLFINNWLK